MVESVAGRDVGVAAAVHTVEWFLGVPAGDALVEGGSPGELAARYEARQRCIEATTFGAGHRTVGQTADELKDLLTAKGIVLPKAAT